MTEKDFRELRPGELVTGAAIWVQGKSFLVTSPIGPVVGTVFSPVCGPFLVERVLFGNFQGIREPRVDLIDPATGDRRSMMSSWLLVPKEE